MMDKYNIITPTDDLDQLNIDMGNWYMLPYDFKMRSNEDCIRIYGCTVEDLYNKIKEAIMKNMDIANTVGDNLFFVEATEWEKMEDYSYRLSLSKKLQENPYIILLDPDITEYAELNRIYMSFMSLNSKNKLLSNDFSWQLWGYNVYDMYKKLYTQLNPETEVIPDQDNINIIEATVVSTRNFSNNARLYHTDILTESVSNIPENKSILSVIDTEYGFIKEESNDLIMPEYCPWFTVREMIDMGIDFTSSKKGFYLHDVLEAMKEYEENPSDENEAKVLSLGWNPAVDITNPKNRDLARDRQINNGDMVQYKDISGLDIEKVTNINFDSLALDSVPIYLVFGYESDLAGYITKKNYSYNRVAISFNITLSPLYIVNEHDGVVTDFSKVNKSEILNISDFARIDVISAFMSKEAATKLHDCCEGNCQIDVKNTMYNILVPRNRLDPDSSRILYSKFVDLIYGFMNKEYNRRSYSTVYIIYSGFINHYDSDKVDKLVQLINSNDHYTTYIDNNGNQINFNLSSLPVIS